MTGTPAQLAALDALCRHGTVKEAAVATGRANATIEAHIRRLRDRNGMTTVQLAWHRGWIAAVVQLSLWVDDHRSPRQAA